MTNKNNILRRSFFIRIKQLQIKEWLHKSPLIFWPFDKPQKNDDWLPSALVSLKKLKISINVPHIFHQVIEGGSHTVYDLIPNLYRSAAKELRQCSLLFVEQLSAAMETICSLIVTCVILPMQTKGLIQHLNGLKKLKVY